MASRKVRDRHRSLVDTISEQILNDIADGVMKPGHQLKETPLAEQYGVSRSSLREGIRRLQGQGLIEIVPSKGSFVRQLTAEELAEIYEMRVELEGLAVRLTTQSMSELPPDSKASIIDDLKKRAARLRDRRPEPSEWNRLNNDLHLALYAISGRKRLVGAIASLMRMDAPYVRATSGMTRRIATADEKIHLIDLIRTTRVAEAESAVQAQLHDAARDLTVS